MESTSPKETVSEALLRAYAIFANIAQGLTSPAEYTAKDWQAAADQMEEARQAFAKL